ncbi:hypothetical protein H2200_002191 [Cladophialophora chaetospira]|uniref:Uncharacterized protein n=1 Tax=Cladophialophora chaetospira TaxID=386627 RepID=A0AA38XIF1_9EURO|nr:hypothetical protein H2200_002191 [Cladophialophora chaetospira]
MPDLSPCERRAIDHFRGRTSADISGEFKSDFWSQEIFQLMRHDDSIKHALIALSSMHEAFLYPNQTTHFGLSQYSKALQQVSTLDLMHAASAEFALVACILFVALESLQSNYYEALHHATSGVRVIAQVQGQQSQPVCMSRETLEKIFLAFDRQVMEFRDPTFQPLLVDITGYSAEIPAHFSSYEAALASIETILKDTFHFAEEFYGLSTNVQTSPVMIQRTLLNHDHLRQ